MNEEETYTGSVIWFDNKKNYGFIGWSKNGVPETDLFLHFSDINCQGYKSVKKDEKVSFNLGFNNSGRLKAINVTVIK